MTYKHPSATEATSSFILTESGAASKATADKSGSGDEKNCESSLLGERKSECSEIRGKITGRDHSSYKEAEEAYYQKEQFAKSE